MKYTNIRDFFTNGLNRKDYFHPQLTNAGYFDARATVKNNWSEIHAWCKETVGPDHYLWTGSIFWFESEKMRNWFILRWS